MACRVFTGVALALLLLDGSPVIAEPAVNAQIAKRQTQLEDAEKSIMEGMVKEKEGDLEAALLNYSTAYSGLIDAPMTRAIRQTALSRFVSASVRHAQGLIKDARYKEAEAVLNLVVDDEYAPDFEPAKKLLRQLDDPEYYNRALTPKHISDVADVVQLLRRGQDFIELQRFSDAKKAYNDVLRIDPTNSAARRGIEDAEVAIMKYHNSSRDHTKVKMLREVDEAWETSVPLGKFAGPQMASGVGEQQSMQGLLDSLIVPSVNFDDMTLSEVVEWLTMKSRQLDPLGKGINFVLNLTPEDDRARNARVTMRVNSMPLSVLLGHINRDTGTKTIAETFAVRIVSGVTSDEIMFKREFAVPPDFLNTADDSSGGGLDDPFAAPETGGGGLIGTRITPQAYFEKAGITFPEGAAAIYNKRTSRMIVRNTQSNLNLIDTLVQQARAGGPLQVEVKLTLIEIKETKLNELGFDWLLGQFNVPGSNRMFGAGGTQGNTEGILSGEAIRNDFPFVPPGDVPLGQRPITAGNRSGIFAQPGNSIDAKLQEAAQVATPTGRAPAVFGIGGALTDPQVQFIVRALNQGSGADLMATPATVVRPGQRSKIEVYREFIYPTEYDPPEIPQDIFQGAGNFTIDPITGALTTSAGSNDNFPVTPAHPTAFEMRPVGTTFEVEPIIGDDGISVNLNLAPEIVRFEGFLNYGSPITSGTSVLTNNEILMPVFNTIKESTNVTVYDGANIVIGGLVTDNNVATDDKTPIFSDVPVFGNLFRTRTSRRERKALIFVVKVRIIDPSGRPVNQLR